MQELIRVQEHELLGQSVDARQLWEFLESKQDFSTWLKNRIEKYDFIEGQDFFNNKKVVIDQSVTAEKLLHNFMDTENQQVTANSGNCKDYTLSIDMAKELSMVERNEKGKEARQYFIACEKQLNNISTANNLINTNTIIDRYLLAKENILDEQQRLDQLKLEIETNIENVAVALNSTITTTVATTTTTATYNKIDTPTAFVIDFLKIHPSATPTEIAIAGRLAGYRYGTVYNTVGRLKAQTKSYLKLVP